MANHNRFRRKNRARRVLEQFGVYQADEIVPSQFSSNLADQLAMFKMAPSQEFEHLRPRSVKSLFVGACGSCTPNSRPTFNSDSMTSQIGIENCLRMPITTLSKNLPVINFSECYENSTYIDYAKELNEEGCDEASELIRKQDAGGGEDQQEAESWMTRLTNWLRRWILNGMFPKGILYHSGQLEVLETCSLQGHPFIFLPVNRSPMDAQVLTEVLAMTKNRLDLATFYGQTPETKSKIWRWSDRQFNFLDRQDWTFHLGWSIQQATIQKLFANDKNLIAFLENDTDDGKPDLVLDNTAVLQHAMECIEQKAVDDVLLVPVGISYDVEPEANCWPCRIIDLLRMWLGFKGRYGAVQVDFDQPFSLREFERNWRKIEDNDKFYQTLGQHVLTTSWRTTQISATEVFAFAEVNNVSLDKAVSELRSLVPGGKADRFSYHCQDANDVETYVEELTNAAKSWPFLTVKAQSPAIMAAFYPEAVVVSALISTMQCPIESYAQTSVTKMVKRSCLLKNCRLLFDLLKLEGKKSMEKTKVLYKHSDLRENICSVFNQFRDFFQGSSDSCPVKTWTTSSRKRLIDCN